MSKHTPGPWEINWYICRDEGKELWRVASSIGPIAPQHSHWARWYIAEVDDARLIAKAPEMRDLIEDIAFQGECECFEAWHCYRCRANDILESL